MKKVFFMFFLLILTSGCTLIDPPEEECNLDTQMIVDGVCVDKEVSDTESPTITLTGSDEMTIEVNTSYIEPGYDCEDLNLDVCETYTTGLDTSTIGDYEVSYFSKDFAGNETTVLRKIFVVDTTSPVVTLTGDATVHLNVADSYVEQGATCTDNYDDECNVVISGDTVNTSLAGTYTVTYTVTDFSGNMDSVSREVIVTGDTTAPVIVLLGDTLYVELNGTFIDTGYLCTDNIDSSCTVDVDKTNLDLTTVGEYTVSYSATDSSGNTSAIVNRTVIVQDTQGRVPYVDATDYIYHEVNTTWEYPTIYQANEGAFTLLRYGSVDETTVGDYPIMYELEDELGNIYNIHITVSVYDTLPTVFNIVHLGNTHTYYPKLYLQLAPYDINNDLIIDSTEIDAITALDFSYMNYKHVDRLFIFSALEEIQLDGANLYDLDFINDFEVLTSLSLEDNYLENEDICIINSLIFLEELNLANNYLSSLSCLSSMDKVDYLDISSNYFSSLADIESWVQLEELNVSDNSLSDFDELLGFINLITLNIDNTELHDLYDIDLLTKLEEVTLDEGIYNYYSLDSLAQLNTLTIEELDADLEMSFFIDYFETYGITVNTKSVTAFDTVNPNVILYDDEISITIGETVDFSDLDVLIYDYYDLYIYDTMTSDVADTSTLTAGEHIVNLSITDTDGNTTTVPLTILVLEDYDLANLVIFIRFADETTYSSPVSLAYFDDLFNGDSVSLRDYYLEVSNNEYNINTVLPDGSNIVFYTATEPRSYYMKYDAITNPNGYADEDEEYYRSQALLIDAVNWVEAQNLVPDDVVLDYNGDGEVDVISFIVSGHAEGWNDLLWPHRYALYEGLDENYYLYEGTPTINGDYAFNYTLQLLGDETELSPYFDLGTFVHEMFHIIGAPDLYHYYSDDEIEPVGDWGLMASVTTIPSHMLQYMKEAYGNWTIDKVTVTSSGTYTLNKSTLETDNVIVIDLGYSNEYLYLEYRVSEGDYEENLPSSGLLVYRVDTDYFDDGNTYGHYDEFDVAQEEVYIFRPSTFDATELASGKYIIIDDGETDDAILTLTGNNTIGTTTAIPMFHSDGTEILITITIVSETINSVEVTIDIQ